MGLLKFGRTPKPQKFNYQTRYYDARKEALEERLRSAEERKHGGTELSKLRITEGFRRRGSHAMHANYRRQQATRSNVLLLGIIAMLCLVVYILFTRF